MFTKKGREAQLQGLYNILFNGAQMEFVADEIEVAKIDIAGDNIHFENGKIFFDSVETIARIGKDPTKVFISTKDSRLIELDVGIDIFISQLPVLRGSILQINEVIIE